jgi:chaperonin GroEL
LLYSANVLDKVKVDNDDQGVGVEIIRRALQAPIRQIAENAGAEGSIIVGKLLEQKDTSFGYDAQKGEFTDLVKAGIIDPAKVVRNALQDAASVASLLITTEAMITDVESEGGDAGAAAAMGGMGGMGGMPGMM